MQVGHSQYLLYISCREGGVRAHAGRAPQYLLYISCREGGHPQYLLSAEGSNTQLVVITATHTQYHTLIPIPTHNTIP